MMVVLPVPDVPVMIMRFVSGGVIMPGYNVVGTSASVKAHGVDLNERLSIWITQQVLRRLRCYGEHF